jgi:hypothetical protein
VAVHGLQQDLPRFDRRTALVVFGGAFLTACGSSATPEETAGPFPGPDALTASGIVRRDITTSFGDFKGTATGVPTTITLELDRQGAVYIWHCDADGRYSMYDIADQNYCRGVQETDGDGRVAFDTVFPAAYPGRWPHMHFEVFESLEAATDVGSGLLTSQLAIPKDICDRVYATAAYEQSAQTMAELSLESDGVFSDGYESQLAEWSGSVDDRIELTLDVRL